LEDGVAGWGPIDEEKTDAADANADWNFSIGEDPSRLENCFVKNEALFFFIPLILEKSIDGLFIWEGKSWAFSLSTEYVLVTFLLDEGAAIWEPEGRFPDPPPASVPLVTSIRVEFCLFALVLFLFFLFCSLFLSLEDET
jgi:hypothetical protein